jgi:hypothetical protein
VALDLVIDMPARIFVRGRASIPNGRQSPGDRRHARAGGHGHDRLTPRDSRFSRPVLVIREGRVTFTGAMPRRPEIYLERRPRHPT